ncbi:hypothetical protein DKL61_13025 [Gammaproteobacteria bacterium ESL0073]|nr:hypothetical protein DKL61_13025 [Gammaproteobacteria bacterium ESL0073]
MGLRYFLAYVTTLCCLSISCYGELLPEVKEKLLVKLPDNLSQNAFVGLLAIESPVDRNPMEIGKQFIIKRVNAQHLAMEKRDINILKSTEKLFSGFSEERILGFDDYQSYFFPCKSFIEKNCISNIMAEKIKTKAFIRHNLLLVRYKVYLKLPIYESVDDDTVGLIGSNYIRLLHLHLKDITYTIADNRVDEGLENLQLELDFAKKALTQNKNITLGDYVIFSQGLRKIYYLISELLDIPLLASQLDNPKLVKLLESFTELEQQSLVRAFDGYRDQELRMLYLYPERWKDNVLNKVTVFEGLSIIAKQDSAFDTDETMNLFYNEMNTFSEESKQLLINASTNDQQVLSPVFKDTTLSLKALSDVYGMENIGGRYYVQAKMNQMHDWRLSQYDLVGYLSLVQLKLKIKQAHINKEEVSNFLKQLNSKASHPYSKQPAVWDEKTQTLSYKWLDQYFSKDNPTMRVYLRF